MLDDTRVADKKLAESLRSVPDVQTRLSLSCFRLMDSLKFNICELLSSFLDDSEVEDLARRVDENISSALQYACRHWVVHLTKTLSDNDVMVTMFWEWLERRYLFWLEAMNLLDLVGDCYHILVKIRQWLLQPISNETMNDLISAENFATNFSGNIIRKSTPHLYISALAAAPRDSYLLARWHTRFQHLPSVTALLNVELPLMVLRHTDSVSSAAFSPDGKHIASCSYGPTMTIWNASNGEKLYCIPFEGFRLPPRYRDTKTVYKSSVIFSLDGSHIFSVSDRIYLWDLSARMLKAAIPLAQRTDSLPSTQFLPDGGYQIASTDISQCTVRFWDVSSCQYHDRLHGPRDKVTSMCFSTDGLHIATGSHDHRVRLWDAARGKELKNLHGHKAYVTSVCFSLDGSHIASGSFDGMTNIWEVSTGNLLHHLIPQDGHYFPVTSVGFCPEGKYITSSVDKSVLVWETSTGRQLRRLNGHEDLVSSAAFSPDGTRIISASHDHTIRVWNFLGGQQLYPLDGHEEIVSSVSFTPDERYIASGSHDGTIFIWEVTTGQSLRRLVGHNDRVNFVSFSSDGKYLVSASDDRTLCIWNVSEWDVLHRFVAHEGWVNSARFSPDGTYIVSGGMDHTVRIWEVSTQRQVSELRHDGRVNSVSFSANGNYVVSASHDCTVRLWDAVRGELIYQLIGHEGPVNSVSFSPDGTHIVSGSDDCTIRLWEVSTSEERYQLEQHCTVSSIDFSRDGTCIVSALDDHSVRVWEVSTRRQLCHLDGHGKRVTCIHISKDHRHIASGSEDGTVHVWKPLVGKYGPTTADTWRSTNFMNVKWHASANGWIMSPHGQRYIWLPPEIHCVLQHPESLVISSKGSLEVNFLETYLGQDWMKCYNG